MLRNTALAFAVMAATSSNLAQASGFRLPEMSVAGLGQANAVVADDGAVGNYGYNMAGMGFHPGTRASVEGFGYSPSFQVTNNNGQASSNNTTQYVPALYATHRFDSMPLAIGLGINAPFGLKTDWPAGTFAVPSAAAAQANALTPTLSQFQVIHVNPGVAYLIRPNLSLAAGMDYYRISSARLDTVGTTLQGSGSAYGFSLGALYTTERFNLGVQYRSKARSDLSGTSSVLGAGSTTLTLPAVAQAGIMYRFSKDWSGEFDLDWTNWSSFDRLQIKGANGSASTTYNWKNTLAYRLGTTYRVNEALLLRAGYAYDQSAVPDAYFSARIPDANRHILSSGLGLKMGDYDWDFGLSYVFAGTRNINSSRQPGVDGDLNGTTFYNGAYKSHALVYGLSLSRNF